MNTTALSAPLPDAAQTTGDATRLGRGIAMGLVAASIGAMYTVFAR